MIDAPTVTRCQRHRPLHNGTWDGRKSADARLASMIRSATRGDFEAISRLCAQLNPDDPPVAGPKHEDVFEQILAREGLDILLLELDGEILGATYLNLIPNLSPWRTAIRRHRERRHRHASAGRETRSTFDGRHARTGMGRWLLQGDAPDRIEDAKHARLLASPRIRFADDAKTAYLARPPR